MRAILLAVSLLAFAYVPVAAAAPEGCFAAVAGLCVRDPGNPCDMIHCEPCTHLGPCLDVERCLDGARGCVDMGPCTCDPEPTPMSPRLPPPPVECIQVMPWSMLCSGNVAGFVEWWLGDAIDVDVLA